MSSRRRAPARQSRSAAPRRRRGGGGSGGRQGRRTQRQGAVRTTLARAAPSVGAKIGRTLGGPVGGFLGRAAGGLFSKIFGRGSYEVKTNTITRPGSYVMDGQDQVPLMHNDRGTARIRHREYVQDLQTSVAFANTRFAINPTNTQLFPWLSALAQNYEQYKILGMVFEWKSLSADALNSTNTALGSVSLATQYNALDAPFLNKQQVLNYQFATSCKPAECMMHPLECDPSQTPSQPLYIRIGSQQSGDARLYDMGILNFVAVGSQAAAIAGELWVTYDILLIKPRLSSGLGLALPSAFYTCSANQEDDEATLFVNNNNPFGIMATAQFDGVGMVFEYDQVSGSTTDCTLKFPVGAQGIWLVQLTWFGTGAAQAAAQHLGTITYTGCTARSGLYNVNPENLSGTVDVGINSGVTGCHQCSSDNIVVIGDSLTQAKIKYAGGSPWVLPPGDQMTTMNVVVTQLNQNIIPVAPLGGSGVFRLELEDYYDDDEKTDASVIDDYEPVASGEGAGGPVVDEKKLTRVRTPAGSVKGSRAQRGTPG
nr:putative capsid protein [Crucivirus sp.]